MNAVRKPHRSRASIIIRRRKPRVGVMRTRGVRRRQAPWRRRRHSAWADAMLDVRTFGWLSRRLGRMYMDELTWRSRRRLGELRR